MANADLKLEPHHIRGREDVWWYEAPRGLEIVAERHPKWGSKTTMIVIPWRSIRACLARKDRPDA